MVLFMYSKLVYFHDNLMKVNLIFRQILGTTTYMVLTILALGWSLLEA